MTITKEILLYQNLPSKKFRWISYVSVLQVGFLALNLIVLPTPKLMQQRQEAMRNKVRKKTKDEALEQTMSGEFQEEYEPNPDYDPATLTERFKRLSWGEIFNLRNVYDNVIERPAMSVGLVGVSVLISSAFCVYARRTVHLISLLPNERVRISFFSPFAIGKPPSIEVPLRNVSCVHGRKSPHNYSILKIKDYTGYHLVHKSEGQFLEPKLYDKHLGFARSWVEKN